MKQTSVFLPEKEMKKKSYTALTKEGEKKSSYFFLSVICVIIVIFWLTFLTVKDVPIRDDDTVAGNLLNYQADIFIFYSYNLERENKFSQNFRFKENLGHPYC